MRERWDGKRCQLCGRFANHFYGTGEDDGSTTYVDERCLTDAERRYFGVTDRTNRSEEAIVPTPIGWEVKPPSEPIIRVNVDGADRTNGAKEETR